VRRDTCFDQRGIGFAEHSAAPASSIPRRHGQLARELLGCSCKGTSEDDSNNGPQPDPHTCPFACGLLRRLLAQELAAAIEKATSRLQTAISNGKVDIALKLWRSDLRFGDSAVSPSPSIGAGDARTHVPTWLRAELRKQLQEKVTSNGAPVTEEEADSFIDNALASGTLDSSGALTFRVKGTRKQIVDQILDVCALWNEPMTRAQAEAKADAVIKASRRRRATAWLSPVILILAMILAFVFIIGLIAAEAKPFS
jgi:hypothetical protein